MPRGAPAVISRTDPAAAWAARTAKGRFGYAFNVMVDTPDGVATDVEANLVRSAAEVDAGRAMLAHAGDRHGYRPKRVVADTASSSGAFLAFVIVARCRTSCCWNAPSRPRASSLAELSATGVSRTAISARLARCYASPAWTRELVLAGTVPRRLIVVRAT